MSAAPGAAPRGAATAFRAAIAAELSKIRTLPATWLTIGGTVALSAVLALFFASQAGGARIAALDVAMAAVPYSQAGLFVLGVVIACSEYVGGQVRTTLIAMPHRVAQRLAATVALVLVAVPAAALVVAANVLTAAAVFAGSAAFPPAATVAGTFLGTVGYLALLTVLASAAGSLTRRALPAAGAVVGYLVVVSPMLLGRPFAFALPDIAGYTLMFGDPPAGAPAAPTAWLIIIAWTLALLVPSIAVHRRRDA